MACAPRSEKVGLAFRTKTARTVGSSWPPSRTPSARALQRWRQPGRIPDAARPACLLPPASPQRRSAWRPASGRTGRGLRWAPRRLRHLPVTSCSRLPYAWTWQSWWWANARGGWRRACIGQRVCHRPAGRRLASRRRGPRRRHRRAAWRLPGGAGPRCATSWPQLCRGARARGPRTPRRGAACWRHGGRRIRGTTTPRVRGPEADETWPLSGGAGRAPPRGRALATPVMTTAEEGTGRRRAEAGGRPGGQARMTEEGGRPGGQARMTEEGQTTATSPQPGTAGLWQQLRACPAFSRLQRPPVVTRGQRTRRRSGSCPRRRLPRRWRHDRAWRRAGSRSSRLRSWR